MISLIYVYSFFKQSLSKNDTMGYAYNWIYIISMLVNIGNLVQGTIIPAVKDFVKNFKEWNQNRKYENWKSNWFKSKEVMASSHP